MIQSKRKNNAETYYKTWNDCRHVRKQRVRRKTQQPNNEDNLSTKSSTQQSQSSILNTLETITSKTNKTQFHNIDNDSDNMYEPLEHRKPTINERLNHIHISLDQVKNQIAQSTNDDVGMLKSWIDNVEVMLEKQNKSLNDIEASFWTLYMSNLL